MKLKSSLQWAMKYYLLTDKFIAFFVDIGIICINWQGEAYYFTAKGKIEFAIIYVILFGNMAWLFTYFVSEIIFLCKGYFSLIILSYFCTGHINDKVNIFGQYFKYQIGTQKLTYLSLKPYGWVHWNFLNLDHHLEPFPVCNLLSVSGRPWTRHLTNETNFLFEGWSCPATERVIF